MQKLKLQKYLKKDSYLLLGKYMDIQNYCMYFCEVPLIFTSNMKTN